jgi:hypothetical protein
MRSGDRPGLSASVARIGRSDNFARGKSRVHGRSDQGGMTSQRPAPGEGALPRATPAQGMPQPPLGPEYSDRRR